MMGPYDWLQHNDIVYHLCRLLAMTAPRLVSSRIVDDDDDDVDDDGDDDDEEKEGEEEQ